MKTAEPNPTSSGAVDGAAELRTREAVVQLLLAEGPLTAVALAERLGISPAGIRRHLDHLVEEGALTSRDAQIAGPRGRGRPARAYLLTETGRRDLPHRYDQFAIQAMEFLEEHSGSEAVTAFARDRAEKLLAPAISELDQCPDVPSRADVVARTLTEAGFAASVRKVGIGEQLCQHHCPISDVAAKYPQMCEEELAVLTRALGTYAQRLATIARGDAFCTTFIPIHAVTAAPHTAAPSTKEPAAAPVPLTPHGRTTA